MAELFLEDVLEKTRYCIQSQVDTYQGNPRRRRRQQESKSDPMTELFEVVYVHAVLQLYSYIHFLVELLDLLTI